MTENNSGVTTPLRYGGVFEQDDIRYLISSSEFVGVNFEGDYTAWEAKWAALLPNNGYGDHDFDYHIDDRFNVINIAWVDDDSDSRWGTFNIADFSTIFLSPAGAKYTSGHTYNWMGGIQAGKANFEYGGVSKSAQTYLLLCRNDDFTIEVWMGGTRLWARDLRDNVNVTYTTSGIISLAGKYILILYQNNNYDYCLIMYEGGTAV